jgi:hypothetical protein
METITNSVPASRDPEPASARDPARVQAALDHLLSSPPFRNTQQCQTLLRYIVKHTLAGEDHLLRERVIGSEVFGRKPDYETGEDPVVRIRAAEVRKRLAQYYQAIPETPELHIDIPPGSYRAIFRWKEATAPDLAPATQTHSGDLHPALPFAAQLQPLRSTIAAQPARHTGRWAFASLIALILIAGASVAALRIPAPARALHDFWQPWTNSPKPVIIVIGSNAVYRLSDAVTDRYTAEHHLETHGMEVFIPMGPDVIIHGSDLFPAENSFVALGDVAAVSDMVASVTRQKQAFQERFPNDVSFAELRNSPTILIGGFNNPMTMELTKDLRFVMRAHNEIDDAQDPNRRWLLHASNDSHDTEDYAIITRMVAHSGDAPVLSVAGLGQYGTLAAADFVCNPASLRQLANQLPGDWAAHNLQVILHLKVVDFKPVATEVVAVHTW